MILAAPSESLEQHVEALLRVWEGVRPRLEPSFRRLFGNDWERVVRAAFVLHDLGKATERWQNYINQAPKVPDESEERRSAAPHAQLGAAYIWWNFVKRQGKDEGLYMPAAFAVAVHHTDETLARPGVEDPASLLVERGVVGDSGRIRWHEWVGEFVDFAQEKLWAELADPREMNIYEVAEFALELRRWARGAPVLELHRRRLQVAAVHSALKVCDIRAAASRPETVELRGELVMAILEGGLQC